MDRKIYNEYLEIMHEELVPALGCTEPIAIAYAAARARAILGTMPEKITARCSGNIIKNVKSVIVPTTGDMKGIEVSAILGAVGGNPEKKMEVLADVKPEDVQKTRELLAQGICTVELIEGVSNLQIEIEMSAGEDTSLVEIAFSHTNIVREEKNGKVLFSKDMDNSASHRTDRSLLNLSDIYEFAETVDLNSVRPMLTEQLADNRIIAEEGLRNQYGAAVGKTILKYYGDDVRGRARAMAAAGSDARMNGCPLPVMTNSGSGNQGMVVSLPVAEYADYLMVPEETRFRALVLSNLVAIYQKNELGKLSAYCGAVSAAAGAGAGIAYLHGADFGVISQTVVNTLAAVSGIVCDGAKSSCAAKIASSVDAAILGFYMAKDGLGYNDGEGLVKEDAEATIHSVGRMGREGMKETDVEILKIMLDE